MKATKGTKLLSLCLALVLVLAVLPMGASAATGGGRGDIGRDLAWSLNEEGLLFIEGSGEMYDFSPNNPAPWYNQRISVKQVQMSDDVTGVGDYAFWDCTNLMHVELSSQLQRIGSHAFSGCVNLPKIIQKGDLNVQINLPNSIGSIGSYAFENCTTLQGFFRMPAGITAVSEGTFKGCTGLTWINVPTGVTYIGSEAFRGCTALQSVSLPSSVTYIGTRAFQDCTYITEAIIPANVRIISDYLFANCSMLSNVSLPAGVTAIGDYAFSRCALASISLPFGVTVIGSGAFAGCTRLEEVAMPSGITELGAGVFENCYGLKRAAISDSVKVIPPYAFSNCVMLESVYLPAKLTTVEVNAFNGCSKLKDIHYPGTREEWKAVEVKEGNTVLADSSSHTGDDPVLPEIPPLEGAEAKPGKITVTWTAAADAELYQVLRKSGSGSFAPVAQTAKLEFNDLNATAGVLYTYTVQAYRSKTGWSDYDTKGVSARAIALVPLALKSLSSDKSSAALGEPITWTAVGQGNNGDLEFLFRIYNQNGSVVEQMKAYTTQNTFTYTPAAEGKYTCKVFARVSEDTGNVLELTSSAVTVSGTAAPLTVSGITADKTAAEAGETVTWTAAAFGGSGALKYCFYIYKDGAAVRKGSYTSANTVSYPVTEPGSYTAKVFVKDGAGSTGNKTSDAVTVSGSAAALTVTGIKADRTTAGAGDTITWTATAAGGSGTLRYCFYIYRDGKTVWKGSYGTAKTASYQVASGGKYTAKVFVKDGSGQSANLAGGAVTASVPISVTGVTANRTTAGAGDTITWTAAAAGGNGTLRYCFYVYRDGRTVWKGKYGMANTVSFTVETGGKYTVKVFVKDSSGQSANLVGGVVTASVPLSVTGITADKTAAKAGDSITWTAAASGGNGTLRYCFYIYKDGKTVKKGSYMAGNSVTYTAAAAGVYTAKVFVKDSTGQAGNKLSGKITVTAS